jgi:hypothetical protein
MYKITVDKRNGEIAHVYGEFGDNVCKSSIRYFKDLETFKNWEAYTKENGNDMTSFYMISTLVNKYIDMTPENWKLI